MLYIATGPSNTPFIDNYNTSGNECLGCGERKNIPTEKSINRRRIQLHVHGITAILLLTWMSKRKKKTIIKWKLWKSQMLIMSNYLIDVLGIAIIKIVYQVELVG
ncbi:uncharacterized protein TM35_001211050 [Trypanosoma theileri]|uniref:Uncharacterized protein n=1 Tax=Trypanosoma theileri TaxID=67003 RepID=A0A1X0NDY6_9TRYP|nr:uncharacterized protein TM35_001211050 [Trypanosoma theileri]ORC81336.1 hypothetical protein TM35_001211050 [Trypanosoma theileri]